MSIYGNKYLCNDLLDKFLEAFSSDDNEEILEEGANIEYTKAVLKFKKEFKQANNEYKLAIKNKDKEAVTKACNRMKQYVKDIKEKIKSIESTKSSVIFGFFANILFTAIKNVFILSLITTGISGIIGKWRAIKLFKKNQIPVNYKNLFLSKTALTGLIKGFAINYGINIGVSELEQLASLAFDVYATQDKRPENLNMYRRSLLNYCDSFYYQIDKMEKFAKATIK